MHSLAIITTSKITPRGIKQWKTNYKKKYYKYSSTILNLNFHLVFSHFASYLRALHQVLLATMNHMGLFSAFSTNTKSSNRQSSISFSLRPAPWDSTKTLVHPSEYPTEAPPMYSIASKDSAPNVVVFRGWGEGPWDIIGDARLPSLSSKIHLAFYGQPIHMCLNELSGSFTFESPATGQLKWKLDMLTGRNMDLQDATGKRLAKLRPGKSGEKVLEILVSHDSRFLELVLLSGWTARTMNKSVTEATGEILSSVVGI